MASLASVVASAVRVTSQRVNDSLIQDLEKESQTLDRIRDSFSRILHRHAIHVWSFVEELAMRDEGRVCVYLMHG